MNRRELMALIDQGRAPVVLDVRSRWEFTRGHIPGAWHVPFWAVPAHALDLPRDARVVVYCGHGPRAWMAMALLRARGFRRTELLDGHMRGWRRARDQGTCGIE